MADFAFKHPVVADFVHLTKPDNQGVYSMTLLIDKDTPEGKENIADVQAAIKEAVKYSFEKGQPFAGRKPEDVVPILLLPLKDGDTDKFSKGDNTGKLRKDVYPEFAGKMFLSVKTKVDLTAKEHGIFDVNRRPVPAAQLYSGMLVRPAVWFHAYDNGNRGIMGTLNFVLRTGDGERLGGGGETDPFKLFGLPDAPEDSGDNSVFDAMGI